MKQALKQIFAGFIYSIMTLSFILSPIPNVNVSWAQADVYRMDDVQGYPSGQRSSSGQGNSSGQGSTSGRDCYDPENDSQSDRLYKPGCELNGVVNKASLENYTGHQKSFVAIMEQAVAGMMAVTLIQSLRYSYLHEVEGQTFGNDCGSNVMGKYTLRIAQLGGLSYILGDIKANTAFQRASKKATDTAFGPPTAAPAGENGEPATEFEAAGHKMKQIRAFNALIEVFEGQEKGLKAKRNLSLVTEGAYAASLGLELGGILRCSSQCKKNMGQYWAKKAMLTAALSKASLALTSELAIATNPVTAACKGTSLPPLATALANLKAQYGVNEIDNKASGQANSVRKAAKDEQDGGFWTGILAGIKGFFGGKKTTDADVAAGSQVAEGQVNEVKKVMGIPVESVDQANAKTQGAANSTKISAKATKDDASIMSIIGLTQAAKVCALLPTTNESIAAVLYAYLDYFYTPIECCGGEAMNMQTQVQFKTLYTQMRSKIASLGAVSVGTWNKIKDEAKAKVMEDAAKQAGKKAMESFMSNIDTGVASSIEFVSEGNSSTLVKGTIPGAGLPVPGRFAKAKDIRVLGLFEGLFSDAGQPAGSGGDSYRYYVKKNFESLIRKFAITNQLEEIDEKNPLSELNQIAELEQKVNNIMFYFDRMIDETKPKALAFNQFKEHELWPVIVNMVSDLVMPKAQASFLGGMAGGVGLKVAQKQLGIKGPWAAILNVGSQFMMVNALLGKFAKSWGFVSPKGRSYTWGAMLAVTDIVRRLDKTALEKVKKYKEIVKDERDRYILAAGVAGIDGNGIEEEERDGSGKLVTRDGRGNPNYAVSSGGVKSCAVPKGEGFAPSACPAKVDKTKFTLPNIDKDSIRNVTPAHLDSASFTSNLSSGLASGEVGVDELASMDLAKVEARNKGMRDHNEKLLKKVDAMDAQRYKGQKNKPTPLQTMLARAKKGLSGSSGSSVAPPPLASLGAGSGKPDASNSKEEKKKEGSGVTKTSAYGAYKKAGSQKAPESQGFDFGSFGEGGVDSEAERDVAIKPEEKLDDFVINHDDINKKKDVSIFKILSNRYLLSYPKVLEEEKPKQ